jgi:membrane associated rhomboid family serine protease/Zn-finger nucleic acid-binding protein
MSLMPLCPTCNETRIPLSNIESGSVHLRCRNCNGEWFSVSAMEKRTSMEFIKRAVLVLENQPPVVTYPCLVCKDAHLQSIYPLFRYPTQEDYGVIPKPNPFWTNVPSYCELHLCKSCQGSWLKAEDIQKLPVLMPDPADARKYDFSVDHDPEKIAESLILNTPLVDIKTQGGSSAEASLVGGLVVACAVLYEAVPEKMHKFIYVIDEPFRHFGFPLITNSFVSQNFRVGILNAVPLLMAGNYVSRLFNPKGFLKFFLIASLADTLLSILLSSGSSVMGPSAGVAAVMVFFIAEYPKGKVSFFSIFRPYSQHGLYDPFDVSSQMDDVVSLRIPLWITLILWLGLSLLLSENAAQFAAPFFGMGVGWFYWNSGYDRRVQ